MSKMELMNDHHEDGVVELFTRTFPQEKLIDVLALSQALGVEVEIKASDEVGRLQMTVYASKAQLNSIGKTLFGPMFRPAQDEDLEAAAQRSREAAARKEEAQRAERLREKDFIDSGTIVVGAQGVEDSFGSSTVDCGSSSDSSSSDGGSCGGSD